MTWVIAYADGTSTVDQAPQDADPTGIICIVQADPDRHFPRELLHEHDWYWWRPDEDRWYGGDIHGLLDQAMRFGAVWPKMGRSIRYPVYQRLVTEAMSAFDDLARLPDADRAA